MNINGMLVCVVLAGAAISPVAGAQPAPGAPPPAAGVHTLALTNSGGTVVSAVYAAPTGSLDFSDDLLGNQVASVGKTVRVKVKDPAGTCVFDFQFLMADGGTATRKAVNVCQSDAYTLTR